MPLRRRMHPTTLIFSLAYSALAGPSWPILLAEPPAVCAFGGAPIPAFKGSSTIPAGIGGGGSRGGESGALGPRNLGRHRLAGDGTSHGWRLRPKLLDRSTLYRCCASPRYHNGDGVGEEEEDGGDTGDHDEGRGSRVGAEEVVTDVGRRKDAVAEGGDGRRITTALELMETLMNSDIDVLKSLQVFSPALGGEEDRVVGDIVRPILARAKRYKAPRVEYEKRQAARKVAEADPSRSVYVYRGGSPDPEKVPVDIRPRARLPPPARQQTLGRNDIKGRGQLSKRAKDARERWENPEYRENIISKRRKTNADRQKKLEADPAHQSDKAEPLPGTVEEIDLFLNTTTVTADEATRAYEMLSQGERTRREKISLRWKDPAKWLANRMAEEASMRRRLSDPAYLRKRKEARSLKAKRAYAVRCANGNSGKGRPRSKADQAKALVAAAKAAAARDAAIKAGLATAADFEEKPKVKKIPKKEIPTVVNRRGRPRKLRTTEEKAAIAFREANGPRPRGRPRKLPLKTAKKPPELAPIATSTVAASLTSAVRGWMAAAAVQAAEEFPSMPPAVGPQVEALAISRTKEMTGAQTGEWTPQMTDIAAAGVEAWSEAWEAVSAAAAAGAEEGSQSTDGDQAIVRAEADAAEAAATRANDSPATADGYVAAAKPADVALEPAPAASLRRPNKLSG